MRATPRRPFRAGGLPIRRAASASSAAVLLLILSLLALFPLDAEAFLQKLAPPPPPSSSSRMARRRRSAPTTTIGTSVPVSVLSAMAAAPLPSSPEAAKEEGADVVVGRAAEIASVALADVALPILSSAVRFAASAASASSAEEERKPTWDEFWASSSSSSSPSSSSDAGGGGGGGTTSSTPSSAATNAEVVSSALERLGPTYVKFGQALASRPDVVPPSLAAALSKLQDRMEPFDTDEARRIIREELGDVRRFAVVEGGGRPPRGSSSSSDGDGDGGGGGGGVAFRPDDESLDALLSSLSPEPVAAASIGQVYRGELPDYGPVAVKVQRPGIRDTVRRDFALLRRGAALVESLPSVPLLQDPTQQERLISTELVAAVDEFMSRIFEELDYRREARNAAEFASLYSDRGGTAVSSFPDGVGVTVPEILDGLCTENVLVMEWIDGSKLTDVGAAQEEEGREEFTETEREENLKLLELAMRCTLSQLLDTGVMHADPHGGNLLKVTPKDDGEGGDPEEGRSRLAYLDFGLLSSVPSQVRDGLVCAVAVLVFARDVDAVAGLFGELQLLPEEVLTDPFERAALREALTITLDEALTFPDDADEEDGGDSSSSSSVPALKFDKLLDALARLVPRFKFELPPYFVNNARALGTLEGIALSLDPDFNVLRVMYPYALNRMLRNPAGSDVVDRTLAGLIRSDGFEGGVDGGGFGGVGATSSSSYVDRRKVIKLLNDSAAITGHTRMRVVRDVIKTRGGQRFVLRTAAGIARGAFRSGRKRGGSTGGGDTGGGDDRNGRRRGGKGRGIWNGDYFKL